MTGNIEKKRKIRTGRGGARLIAGILCIAAAFLAAFAAAPALAKRGSRPVYVLACARNIPRGERIDAGDVRLVQAGPQGLPPDILASVNDAVGRYAASSMLEGQFIMAGHLTGEARTAEEAMASLEGDMRMISVPLRGYAEEISGKIENGDIVQAMVLHRKQNDGDADYFFIPPELTYLRVVTTTASNGLDRDEREDAGGPSGTVTFTVLPVQAELLALYSDTTVVHYTLVCKADSARAAGLISEQEEYIRKTERGEDG